MLTATRWACTLLLVVAVPALAQSSQAPAAASRTTATTTTVSSTTSAVSTAPVSSEAAAPKARLLEQWDDVIKDIPLAGERPITLTISGQARWREEFFRAFNTGELDDDHGQSRLLISADLVVGERKGRYARLFAEGRDAQSYGRTLPGGARPNDADRSDVQNLWIDLGSNKSYVRVGRQEIALGAQRLFGVPDWSNTRRGSQGVRLYTERGRFALEGIQARPMVVRQYARNHADTTQQFRTLSLGNATGAAPLWRGLPATWQAYWYEQQIESASAPVRRLTTGGRLMWDWGKKSALARSLEFEGAKQGGAIGARRLDGWFWVGEATVRWTRLRGAPSLALGIEEASGENRSTGDRQEAFAVLYPAAHAHGGYADVIGRTNVRELHLFSTWSPVRSVNLRFAAYRFDRLRLDDGVWTKQNSVFRAASGNTARHAADELDLTGVWKATAHTQVIFGGALVLPGAFLRNTPGGARTERWGFVGTAFTF